MKRMLGGAVAAAVLLVGGAVVAAPSASADPFVMESSTIPIGSTESQATFFAIPNPPYAPAPTAPITYLSLAQLQAIFVAVNAALR